MTGPTNQAVLDTLQRVELKLDNLDCKIQSLEKANVKNDAVANTVDDHEKRLRELERLAPAMRAVIWLAAVLGVSVVALIWALITGQAMVVFAK